MLCDESTEPKSLELSLLKDITNNFSDDREIGRSEFGVVYKQGKLRNGDAVVVKRLAIAVDDKLFLDAVHCLMSVKHNNIVRFLGYCANTNENVTKEGGRSVSVLAQERLLCFECLCNGNLEMHLTDETSGLDWHMRYQIIKQICQGLHYLHDNCITHLDLKPGNILFDEKMVPKLLDCGYSRLLSEEISRGGLRNVGGSLAYMVTPEYLDGGAITYKSDIYSLGIIIMQIVTGRNKKDCSNTVGVLENWRRRLTLDRSMGDTSLERCCQQVKICIEIGMSCMDHDPGNRSTTQHIIHRFEKTDVTERSVRSDLDSSYLKQMIRRWKAALRPAVAESKASPATVVAESKTSPATIVAVSKGSPAPTPINTTPHRSITKPKKNVSLFPRPASPFPANKPISPATMLATDYQGSSSHSPFSSFGHPLLSRSQDSPASPAMLPSDLEEFQCHVAVSLTELIDGEGFLSLAWIRRLLEAFLQCQEDFWVLVAHAVRPLEEGWVRAQAERLLVDYHQRMVKALDVCNAASDSIDQLRRWGRLASIAASVLLAPGKIHEGRLRRARKALSDLSVLLVDNAATAGVPDGIASHRSHSVGPAPRASSVSSYKSSVSSSKSTVSSSKSSVSSSPASFASSSPASFASSSESSIHFDSVPHTWSAARQLQTIGLGLAVPRTHKAGLAAPVYAMVCVLHLVSWVLVAAIPYLDRGAALQADHLPVAPLRTAFPWAPPLLVLQECLAEEGKRKDRLNSRGLLKEIHALEKRAQRLAEAIDSALTLLAIDSALTLLAGEREATVRKAAAELASVCAAMKDGLEQLERQVREVYHHIVCYRMEGLDLLMLNAN